jgi:hypothetical protein
VSKRRKNGNVVKFPVRRVGITAVDPGRKLSDILKEMALRLLKRPGAIHLRPTIETALLLAAAAWNSALGHTALRDRYRDILAKIDWDGAKPWAELRSADSEQLVEELVEYKRAHYPGDRRLIVGVGLNSEDQIQVQWEDQERLVAPFAAKPGAAAAPPERNEPLAEKILARMKREVHGKVTNLKAVIAGRTAAKELQKTVASMAALDALHPAHAAYVYAQNQVSVLAEQLSGLDELAPLAKMISEAEDTYLPSGPPMSPLTKSYFSCWSCFDACVGAGDETLGTAILWVCGALGMDRTLLGLIQLMQDSRMGVYGYEGREGDLAVLRDLATDASALSHHEVPAGWTEAPEAHQYVPSGRRARGPSHGRCLDHASRPTGSAGRPPAEDAVAWRPEGLEGVEALSAHYRRQVFRPHRHDGFLMGVIEVEGHAVWCRGARHLAGPETLATMDPCEVHHGGAGTSGGWRQRMLYLTPAAVDEVLEDALDRQVARGAPHFGECFRRDRDLAAAFLGLHALLADGAVGPLERQARFDALTAAIFLRYAGTAASPRAAGRAPEALERVREYLHAHMADPCPLHVLARVAGLRRRPAGGRLYPPLRSVAPPLPDAASRGCRPRAAGAGPPGRRGGGGRRIRRPEPFHPPLQGHHGRDARPLPRASSWLAWTAAPSSNTRPAPPVRLSRHDRPAPHRLPARLRLRQFRRRPPARPGGAGRRQPRSRPSLR